MKKMRKLLKNRYQVGTVVKDEKTGVEWRVISRLMEGGLPVYSYVRVGSMADEIIQNLRGN
jgi:hypothetical protein